MMFTSSRLSLQQICAACLLCNLFTVSSAERRIFYQDYCLGGRHDENGGMYLVFDDMDGPWCTSSTWFFKDFTTIVYHKNGEAASYCIAVDYHPIDANEPRLVLRGLDQCATTAVHQSNFAWFVTDARNHKELCVTIDPNNDFSEGGRAVLTLSGDHERCSPWKPKTVGAINNSSGVRFGMQTTVMVSMIFYAILGSLNMA